MLNYYFIFRIHFECGFLLSKKWHDKNFLEVWFHKGKPIRNEACAICFSPFWHSRHFYSHTRKLWKNCYEITTVNTICWAKKIKKLYSKWRETKYGNIYKTLLKRRNKLSYYVNLWSHVSPDYWCLYHFLLDSQNIYLSTGRIKENLHKSFW